MFDLNFSIEGWLNTVNNYASDAIASADSLAAELNSFTPPIYNSSIGFTEVTSDITLASTETPPVPIFTAVSAPIPVAPSFTAPTIVIPGEAPLFTEPSPSLNLPSTPAPLAVGLPSLDYTIQTDFDFPADYTYTLPEVPTLFSLNIPNAPDIVIPSFDINFPTSNGISIPDITFSFTENIYSDTLLNDVKNSLIYRLQGSTGLPVNVETALYNRERDREQTAALQAERVLLTERNSVGFSRPTGSALSALTQVVQETQSKIIDLSREIMIKQAELEQENLKTSIQQVIALEDILVRQHNNINQRSFEVAKYVQDIAVEIFKSRVSLFNAEVTAYQAYALAFNYKVQAKLGEIEIFKAKIDSQRLINEVNKDTISLYLSKIEGVKAGAEVFRTIIESVSERIKAETLKLEIYKTKVTAYAEAARAKASEYTIYSEQIKGELAKVDVYDSTVKAYTSKVQGYSAQADIATKIADTQVDIQKLSLDKYSSELDAYVKHIQANELIYAQTVDVYKGESEIYLAKMGYNKAAAELALKNLDNVIQQNKYKSDVSLENARVTLEGIKSAYNATVEGKKAAGSMYAQIGSSALQALNVSAAAGTSFDNNYSETHSFDGV